MKQRVHALESSPRSRAQAPGLTEAISPTICLVFSFSFYSNMFTGLVEIIGSENNPGGAQSCKSNANNDQRLLP